MPKNEAEHESNLVSSYYNMSHQSHTGNLEDLDSVKSHAASVIYSQVLRYHGTGSVMKKHDKSPNMAQGEILQQEDPER